MFIEGNKDTYKLKLGMNGAKFEWVGALWNAVDQPNITTQGLKYPEAGKLPSTLTIDGEFSEDIWNTVNTQNAINVNANGANVNIVGTVMEEGVLLGVTVNHTKAPEISTNGGTNWYNYMNIEFHFNGQDTQFIYTCKNEQYVDSFFGYCKTVNNGSSYTSTFEIYVPFTSIGVANGTTSLQLSCSGWVETGWCWFFPVDNQGNGSWNPTHTITTNGIVAK